MAKLDKDLVDICADAFITAWTAVRTGQSLVYDTLEYVLGEDHELLDDVWNAIKRRYDARDYAFGVFIFPNDPTMRLRQFVIASCTNNNYPELVEHFGVRLRARLKIEAYV